MAGCMTESPGQGAGCFSGTINAAMYERLAAAGAAGGGSLGGNFEDPEYAQNYLQRGACPPFPNLQGGQSMLPNVSGQGANLLGGNQAQGGMQNQAALNQQMQALCHQSTG